MLLSRQLRGSARLLSQHAGIAVKRVPSKLFCFGNRQAALFPINNCSFGIAAVRWYTPMTAEEEEKEKARVSHLSAEEKDRELRDLNRQLARLE